MVVQNGGFPSIEQLKDQYLNQPRETMAVSSEGQKSFQEILEAKEAANSTIHFSKHAVQRLSNRNIKLTETQMERLQEGTFKASKKGIRESLVLVDQLAFIVNIPNNTVVTAMQQGETNENVFTNIDGAVII